MRTMQTITLDEARRMADLVVLQAYSDGGEPIALCIMDLEGRILVVMTMDSVNAFTTGVAMSKADSALQLNGSTATMLDSDWSDRDRMICAARGLVPWKGGDLIVDHAGSTVCAIGISGRSEDEDAELIRFLDDQIIFLNGVLIIGGRPADG